MNFQKFSDRRLHLFLTANTTHGEFSTKDNTNFIADIEITTLDNVSYGGVIAFKVEDDLLQRVDVNYNLDKDEFKIFQEKLFKNFI